jgi:hypothetical protein
MPGWLQILLSVIIILAILAGISYGIYKLYKYLGRKGSCHFVAYSPPSTAQDTYIQAGYIACGGGGPFWKKKKITVYNNGPGTFYLDPVPGYSGEQELDVKNSISWDPSNGPDVNIYYVQGSKDTKPNFTISAS